MSSLAGQWSHQRPLPMARRVLPFCSTQRCAVILDHGSNTSLHLAEYLANYRGKRYMKESSAVLVDGVRRWITYQSPDLMQDADFAEIGDAYEAAHGVARHKVGQAEVRFMRQRPLVDWAVPWMEKHRDFREGDA